MVTQPEGPEPGAERDDATEPIDEVSGLTVPVAAASPEAVPAPIDARDLDDINDEPEPLPLPPRRRRLSVVTALLALALVGAAGFYGGVLVQKHQTASSSSTNGTPAALASRFGAGRSGAGVAAAGGGGAGAGGAAGAGRVAGQVKLVDGSNIYVTDAQGNTVKVATAAASQITKSVPGKVGDFKIGDTVVVSGPQGADGTYQAQRITIGGAGGFGGGGFGGRGASAGAGN